MEYSIGIDIGGSKILMGIINADGKVIHNDFFHTPQTGKSDVLDVLKLTRQPLFCVEEL